MSRFQLLSFLYFQGRGVAAGGVGSSGIVLAGQVSTNKERRDGAKAGWKPRVSIALVGKLAGRDWHTWDVLSAPENHAKARQVVAQCASATSLILFCNLLK